jgi:hypothetical protein
LGKAFLEFCQFDQVGCISGGKDIEYKKKEL